MTSVFPIISLLLVVVVSLLVVRVATVALALTGLSHQLARFQARSAFTGAGFTTSESEKVTQHPVRRKIIMMLMLLGNAGIVTAVSSLMLSFVNARDATPQTLSLRIIGLVFGVAILWAFAHSTYIDRRMTSIIEVALKRWTDLEVRDYEGLLHLARGYSVAELEVQPSDWLAERELATLKLADEGVLVLGVQCGNGEYIGAPRGQTKLSSGDSVILYGPSDTIANLDDRSAGSDGNWDHHKAVNRQRRVVAEEERIQEQKVKVEPQQQTA